MTEEIKQRIETIKAGKVPDGYKRTVVGIVPNEWENKRLSELLKFQNGVNADKEKYNSGIKMISVMDILSNSPIFYDNIRGHVDIDEKTLNNYSVTYGDILFQRSSETVEDAGKSNVYMDEENIATYSGFVIRGKKVSDYNPFYLNELLKSSKVRQQIIKYSAGSQHINVSQDSLSKVNVCFTNKHEQNRIAEILLKWDKVIELQEKLIEKLELQKKALMQKLLKPKKEWKPVPLKKILKERKTYSTKGQEYIHVTLSKQGICDKTDQYERDFLVTSENKGYKITKLNDLCYNPANLKFGVICLNKYGSAIFSPIYVTFEISEIYNCDFIGAVLASETFINKIRRFEEGSLYERQAVKPNDFIKDTILIPDRSVQDDIAKAILKIDKQIRLHNEKLNLLKYQQKAMQQLLLTGIVRV